MNPRNTFVVFLFLLLIVFINY